MRDVGALVPPRLAIVSRGVRAIATLPALLDDATLVTGPAVRWSHIDAVLAWGRKPSAAAARRHAQSRGVPVIQIEDGFLRSLALGDRDPPLSIVVDDLGVYYDAHVPSRLERQVSVGCDGVQAERAAALIDAWRANRVSKYNGARDPAEAPPEGSVLVVDQTFGDASIGHGMADAGSFARMLEAALDEHPGAPVILKVHPDVVAGRRRGHFERLTAGQSQRVTLWSADTHPATLLERAAAVYTVTSQMGFEALLWGKPVRCFGMPFYAGWALTHDLLAAPSRRRPVALSNLVHAALVDYPRYIDPETGARCEVERLIEWMSLQRRMRARFPAHVHAIGFSRWKKPIVRAYFGGSDVAFLGTAKRVPAGATVAVWGQRPAPPQATQVVRLEDGFLRSVGLGADLVRPLSWVMDRTGLYYDAARPSELERLCATAYFDATLLERASALRKRIVAQGITKYNLAGGGWVRPAGKLRVVLVPGQVETDASIAHGALDVRSNIALLRAARAAAPDAYIIYKPHPDVVAGLRRAGASESDAIEVCDEIVVDVPMDALLQQVDEVHVMTSLAGFEALLRGRRVVVHGQPFYAGWGLTQDRHPAARRGRQLTVDELVAATLILYPSYVSRTTGRFTTPERVLEELAAWRARGASQLPAWRRLWRGLKRNALQFGSLLR